MIEKIFKVSFSFCLFALGILGIVYAVIALWTMIIIPLLHSDMPYCDDINMSTPRPVGYQYYCKGREKQKSKIKMRGIIRNGILFEFN